MFQVMPQKHLVLASGSPRRREMFDSLGIAYELCVPEIDETPIAHEEPARMVERLARAKAERGASSHPKAWVLGADTTVVLDGQILGKPHDAAHACEMLQTLQGRQHQVVGGFALYCKSAERCIAEVYTTDVELIAMTPAMIEGYVATQEPLDKAGAYAIQGIGAHLVRRVDGSYSNVVGLPLAEVVGVLRRLGVLEVCPT